jgi:hypothetical protein
MGCGADGELVAKENGNALLSVSILFLITSISEKFPGNKIEKLLNFVREYSR